MPYAELRVTGFEPAAQDYTETRLDLNALLVRNEPATFFVRAQGNALRAQGVFDRDILVVDRSCSPSPGDVVLTLAHGEYSVRLFERAEFENEDARAVGVVTYSIHRPGGRA